MKILSFKFQNYANLGLEKNNFAISANLQLQLYLYYPVQKGELIFLWTLLLAFSVGHIFLRSLMA